MAYRVDLANPTLQNVVHAEIFRNSRKVGEILRTTIKGQNKFFTVFYNEKEGARFNRLAQKVYRKGGPNQIKRFALIDNDYTEWYTKQLIHDNLYVRKWWSKIDYVLSGRAFGIHYTEE